MKKRVVLVLERAPAATDDGARFPALEMLLARGRRRTLPAPGTAGLVACLAGVQVADDWSVACVSRLGEQGTSPLDPSWLRADPVHLLPAGDRLRLVPPDALHIGADTAQALVQACNAHFRPEGHRFEAPHPRRWYLTPARELRVTTHAPQVVAGRDILPYMPDGPDAVIVKRIMTEAQMILHRASGQAAEPAANSIWIWGGGTTPQPPPAALPPLWSGEPFARGLWRLTGNPVSPLPPTAAHWLAQVDIDGVADLGTDSEPADRRLDVLERDWCAPLLRAVAEGEVAALELVCGNVRYTVTRNALRRFWRRRRRLASDQPHAH